MLKHIVLAAVLVSQVSQAQSVVDAGIAPEAQASPPKPYSFGAYAEAFYQWNFNNPSNGITNFRGFDNRHNSFTIANVAIEANVDFENIVSRVALQVGHTPSTYYLGEPGSFGSAGANGSGNYLWQYVQEAWVGYRFNVSKGLLITGGIFLSPIGPENMAVKDNWNWSRSNLFFGLPFYHTGLRAQYSLTESASFTLGIVNGWNSVVDNNAAKSVMAQFKYVPGPHLTLSVLYFGGIERPIGTPEGQRWRNLFDAHVTWQATERLAVMAHANAGFELNRIGPSSWVAGALAARFQVVSQLFVAIRVDGFSEQVASNETGAAASIFWPVAWVASGTATLDYRPAEHISFRLEYRHDQAAGAMFFKGDLRDGTVLTPQPNSTTQDTVTLGVTSWF